MGWTWSAVEHPLAFLSQMLLQIPLRLNRQRLFYLRPRFKMMLWRFRANSQLTPIPVHFLIKSLGDVCVSSFWRVHILMRICSHETILMASRLKRLMNPQPLSLSIKLFNHFIKIPSRCFHFHIPFFTLTNPGQIQPLRELQRTGSQSAAAARQVFNNTAKLPPSCWLQLGRPFSRAPRGHSSSVVLVFLSDWVRCSHAH